MIQKLQATLKYHFTNQSLLQEALTHRSFLNENHLPRPTSNERLEFLGDAVLELWVSQELFRRFPTSAEGTLTNLRALIVCTQNLSQIANSIHLGDYLRLSRGEETHSGRTNHSILADTFESVIGAIYIDSGFDSTAIVLNTLLDQNIITISQQKIYKDPKSHFQEIAQEQSGITPHYQITKETGPDHQKNFEATVYVGDRQVATGGGNSKQRAEEAAALAGIKILQN